MKKIISLFFVFVAINVLAQDTITTYFDRHWNKTYSDKASYFRNAYLNKDLGLWVVKDYYIDGKIQMEGLYLDKKLKKQTGEAVFYHYNGNISAKGQYSDGKKEGIWKYYYFNANIKQEGKMVSGKQDSLWNFYDRTGFFAGKAYFINDKEEGESTWYYPNGKIAEELVYKKGKVKSKINYDENGTPIKIKEKDHFIDNVIVNNEKIPIMIYLKNNITYPEELQAAGKEGNVLIHFVVRKDGSIESVKLAKADHPLFNKEVLRVVKMIQSFEPVFSHGMYREVDLFSPFNFRLTR